jgi:predicted phage terminase large subunit-like protein
MNVQKKPVFIVAPTQAQAKILYWQPLLDAFGSLVANINVNEGLIYLKNGVLVGVKGSDRPDTLRGVGLYFLVMDEYADIKQDVWQSILRPALSDVRGRALFIGSPKGRNHFHELWKRGKDGKDAEWTAFHYTSLDNPFLDPAEIESARADMSSAAFRREYLASFDTAGSDTFKEEWIQIADTPPVRERKGGKPGEKEEIPGDWYIAVDLGNMAGIGEAVGYQQKRLDQTAIAVVRIDEEKNWWVRDVHLGRWTADETARRIVDACESVKTTTLGIEKGALYNIVAPKIVTEASKRKLSIRPTPLSHENTAKTARIVWALAGPMEHKRVYFRRGAWNKEIVDQLLNFPSPLVHDDGIEALAYIDQLAKHALQDVFASFEDEEKWAPGDAGVGY